MTHTFSQHQINSQCLNEYSQRLKSGPFALSSEGPMGWDLSPLCGKHKTGSRVGQKSSDKVTADLKCQDITPSPLSTFITKGLFFKVGHQLIGRPENSPEVRSSITKVNQDFWNQRGIDILHPPNLTHKSAAASPALGPWVSMTGYNPLLFTGRFLREKTTGKDPKFMESCVASPRTLYVEPQKMSGRNKIGVINTTPESQAATRGTEAQPLKPKDVLRRGNSNKRPLLNEKPNHQALPDSKKAEAQNFRSVARSGRIFEEYGRNGRPLSKAKTSKIGHSGNYTTDRSSESLPFYSYSLNFQLGVGVAPNIRSDKQNTHMPGLQGKTKDSRIPKKSGFDPRSFALNAKLEKTDRKLRPPSSDCFSTNGLRLRKSKALGLNLKAGGSQAPFKVNCPLWGILLFSREELAFLNLRSILSTLLKALHVCLFAALNNKRILFVGDPSPLTQEHQQRLLSSFIGCQVKAFSTKVTERLPPHPPFLKPGLLKASTLFSEILRTSPKMKSASKISSQTLHICKAQSTARLASSTTPFDNAVLGHDKTVKKDLIRKDYPFLSHLYGLIAHSSPLHPSLSVINARTNYIEPQENSMNQGVLSQLGAQESSTLANYDLRQTVRLSPNPQLRIGRLGQNLRPSRELRGIAIEEDSTYYISHKPDSEPEPKPCSPEVARQGPQELDKDTLTRPEVITPQSDKDTIDLSTPFFYNPMAKLVSKASIRNSQWTATLAQSTHGLIGGFFSNGLARYEQSLASTTKLNILIDGSVESWMNYPPYSETGVVFGNLNNPRDKLLDRFASSTPAEENTGEREIHTQSKLEKFNFCAFDKTLHRMQSCDCFASPGLQSDTLLPAGSLPNSQEKPSAKSPNITPLTDFKNLCETQELQTSETSQLIKSKDDLFFEKPFFEYIKPSHLLNAMNKTTDGLRNAIYSPVPKKRGWAIGKLDLSPYPTMDKRKKGCSEATSQGFRGQNIRCDKHRSRGGRRLFQKTTQNHYQGILNHCLYSQAVTDTHNPWLKEADLVFFTNPEKSKALLNQINRLGIPTLGIVNSGSNLAFPFRSVKGPSLLSSSPTLTYPIIGNSDSLHFLRMILAKFLCILNRERRT